jgi:hypothetical protein
VGALAKKQPKTGSGFSARFPQTNVVRTRDPQMPFLFREPEREREPDPEWDFSGKNHVPKKVYQPPKRVQPITNPQGQQYVPQVGSMY